MRLNNRIRKFTGQFSTGIFLLGAVFLQSGTATADSSSSPIQVLRVVSDSKPGFSDIRLNINDQSQLSSVLHYTEHGLEKVISLEDLSKGAVLLQSDGYEVIKLVCKHCSPDSGGVVEMVYLSNGILNTYNIFAMEIRRNDDDWYISALDNGNPRPIKSMFVVGRTIVGKLIGIKKVIVE